MLAIMTNKYVYYRMYYWLSVVNEGFILIVCSSFIYPYMYTLTTYTINVNHTI